jgi:hypothetical protein
VFGVDESSGARWQNVTADVRRFGSAADALIGRAFTASLATNSLKLAFDPENHRHEYIWIDPPWTLYHQADLTMSASEYSDNAFKAWTEQLTPVRSAEFLSWSVSPDFTTTFELDRGYRFVLPPQDSQPGEDCLFDHWFAAQSAG